MSRFVLDEVFWRRVPGSELVAFGRNYEVFVYERGTDTLATLWSAEVGGVEVAQPLRTNDDGQAVDKDGNLAWFDYAPYDVAVNGERFAWPPFSDLGEGGGGGPEKAEREEADEALAAGIAAKQDSATAATDAELTAAKGALEAAIVAEEVARKAADALKADKTFVEALLAAADAMVFKGVIDCSANPNYPAADAGHLYRVSVAGKIGGGAGVNVEIGDTLLCLSDSTAAGNQATVGAKWNISQANVDGAVIGPAGAVSGQLAAYEGTTGRILKDSGLSLDTTVTLGTSDAKLSSQKAVKAYVDAAKGLIPCVNVKDFGAKGDGVTDDKVAILAAIASLAATGGVVYFPPGTYLTSGTLTLTAGVYLVGSGMADQGAGFGTTIKKKENMLLVDISGTKTANHLKFGGIRDMILDGGGKTGTLVRCYHADDLTFERLNFANNVGRAFDCVELWDSRLDNIMSNNCGGKSGAEPAFHIRSALEPLEQVGEFGKSSDNTNQIFMRNFRVESFRDGGIWIESWGAPYSGPLAVYMDSIKVESFTLRGQAIKVGSTCKDIHLRNCYVAMQDFDAGFSTKVNAIEWLAAERNSLEHVFITNGGTATILNGLYLWANDTVLIDIEEGYGTAPSEKHIKVAGGGGYRFNTKSQPEITVASANTITAPTEGLIEITGALEVKKITAMRRGAILFLKFASTAKLVDGENLKLIEGKTASGDDIVGLISNGTNWYQIAPLAAN